MRTNLAIAICEVRCRGGVLDACVGEGEEYDGRAAFGGQERSIYAAVALAPRRGRTRDGAGPGRMIGFFIDDTQIHFHL
jgi:hypothetical protein